MASRDGVATLPRFLQAFLADGDLLLGSVAPSGAPVAIVALRGVPSASLSEGAKSFSSIAASGGLEGVIGPSSSKSPV